MQVDAGVDVDDLGRESFLGKSVGRRERALPDGDESQVLLVDLHDELRVADRRQLHEHVRRLHDVAALDVSRNQHPIPGSRDDRVAQARLGGRQTGARLIEQCLRHDVVAPARPIGEDLKLGAADLRAGDVEQLGRVVERHLRRDAGTRELCRPVVGLLCIEERRLRLPQRLLGEWQRQLAYLAQTRICLGQGALALNDGRASLAIIEYDQRVAGLDRLPFRDGNIGDDAGDLAADVDAKGCLDVPARHNALHEIRAHHRIGIHHWAEKNRHPEIPQEGNRRDERRRAKTPRPRHVNGFAQVGRRQSNGRPDEPSPWLSWAMVATVRLVEHAIP